MARIPLVRVPALAAAAAPSGGRELLRQLEVAVLVDCLFRSLIAIYSTVFLFLASGTRPKEPRNIKEIETYRPQCGREVIVMDTESLSLAA